MVQAEEYKMLCVGGKLSPTSDNKQFRDDKNLQDYEVIYGLSDDDLKFVAEVNQVTTGLPDLEPEIYCISDDEFDMEDKDSTVTSSGDLEPELDDDTSENHKTDDDEGHKAVADVQLLEPEVYDDTAEDHKVKGREHKARADDQKQKTKVYDATRSKCKKESRKRNIKKETEKLNKRKREVEAQLTNLMESTRIAKKSIQQKIDVGSRSIYVGNVDPEATSEELKQHFHGCGFISRVEILCNSRDGNPNRIANIEFKDKDSVRISLAMDNSLFRGRQITVIPKRANPIDIKAKRSSKEFSRDTRETDRQTDEEFTREATRGSSRCRESIRENTRGCYDDYTSVHRSSCRYRKGYSVTY